MPRACAICATTIHGNATMCGTCTLRLAAHLLALARVLPMLDASLDATLHPGGHQPARTRTATPPTPVRLDVLDLIDATDANAYILRRLLDGTDPVDPHADATPEDLFATLLVCAGHPRLDQLEDAPMWTATFARLDARARLIVDPPCRSDPIGTCELCGTPVSATDGQDAVTCPMCGREQSARTVRLRRLKLLCWDQSHHAGAAQVARTFTQAGIKVSRKTLGTWERRGKLARHPDGYAYSDVYRLLVGGTRLDTDAK